MGQCAAATALDCFEGHTGSEGEAQSRGTKCTSMMCTKWLWHLCIPPSVLNSDVLVLPLQVCGTLINFTADSGHKHALVGMGAVGRLMEVMDRMITTPQMSVMEVSVPLAPPRLTLLHASQPSRVCLACALRLT